jgi:hypothetical protein
MDYSSDILLTNTNYFQWKYHMEDLLISKGLYWITMGKELEPIDDENKFKWAYKNVEAHGLIGMFISPYLRFHLQVIDDPDDAWAKFESVFHKLNII